MEYDQNDDGYVDVSELSNQKKERESKERSDAFKSKLSSMKNSMTSYMAQKKADYAANAPVRAERREKVKAFYNSKVKPQLMSMAAHQKGASQNHSSQPNMFGSMSSHTNSMFGGGMGQAPSRARKQSQSNGMFNGGPTASTMDGGFNSVGSLHSKHTNNMFGGGMGQAKRRRRR